MIAASAALDWIVRFVYVEDAPGVTEESGLSKMPPPSSPALLPVTEPPVIVKAVLDW